MAWPFGSAGNDRDADAELAEERLNGGQVEAALEQLGQADASMERLRRRV